jgi:hypothetical protein
MQLSLTRRSNVGLTMNGQYTLGYSKGNTGGSNEAVTAGNNAREISDFDYDDGYNNFDVRHTFNVSALFELPGTGPILSGWSVAGIFNARSGIPVPVLISAQRYRLRRRAGNVFQQPGGGSHSGRQHARRWRLAQQPAGRTLCQALTSSPSRMDCCSSIPRRLRRRSQARSATSSGTPSMVRGCGRPTS